MGICHFPLNLVFYQTLITVFVNPDENTNNLICQKKEIQGEEAQDYAGTYFIGTCLKANEETTVLKIYNTIREIESTFRCLKTDIESRSIYHKNDDASMVHLHLAILAYWLVITVRHQLKKINKLLIT